MKQLLFIIFILISIKGITQNKKIDSLRALLLRESKDTSRINILNTIAWEFRNNGPDSSIYYARQALPISQKTKFEIGLAESYLLIGTAYSNLGKLDDALLILIRAKRILEKLSQHNSKENYRIKKNLSRVYNSIGNVYSTLGNYNQALKNHQDALKLRSEIGDKPGIASSYNNIGIIYKDQGNYVEALKNHFASLKIKESLSNKEGMAISYNNIGVIYKYQGNNEQALTHFKNSLKIAEEIRLSDMITTCYLNIGAIYTSQKRYEEGLKNYLKAYDIAKQNENREAISDVLGNIGTIYTDQGKYEEALKNEFKALKIKEELEDNASISSFQNNIANIYQKKGEIQNAVIYGEKSLNLAKRIGAMKQIQESSHNMITIYQKARAYQKAFEMQELYSQSTDSILNNSNQREIMRQEFKYNYEKQSFTDSLNYENEKKISELENQVKFKTEKNKRVTLYIGLALVIIFSAFIFNRFRITKKQKNIIEFQSKNLEITHNQLAEKTKELKDSILYSKEIQNTFLKSPTDSRNYFKDTLLVYKPKDVVSGDFYWYKEFDDKLFVVVGDSTGHGVPGAIISVLAIQSLEKTIHEIKNIENLHELNEHIKNEFNAYYKLDGHVSIGLDYSVICINRKDNKLYVSGSGANVLIKDNNGLNSYKFDTINIGGSAPIIYEPSTVILDLKTVRSIFLYTDGIIDQKGWVTGKKFGTKKLKELLLNLNTNDTTIASKKIEEEFNNWIGTIEQIDDITLLGIQIHQA
jgi:tetratricopeptide (TPR) repeat protein